MLSKSIAQFYFIFLTKEKFGNLNFKLRINASQFLSK